MVQCGVNIRRMREGAFMDLQKVLLRALGLCNVSNHFFFFFVSVMGFERDGVRIKFSSGGITWAVQGNYTVNEWIMLV